MLQLHSCRCMMRDIGTDSINANDNMFDVTSIHPEVDFLFGDLCQHDQILDHDPVP